MRQRGFSLLEMTLAVAIMGIAAAAVTLNVMSPIRRATMEDIVGQIAAFDNMTRTWARNQDRPLIMTVDISEGRIYRGRENNAEPTESLKIPKSFRISRLVVGGSEIAYGDAEIPFSGMGLSPTYAMLIEGKGSPARWIIVVGLTGEVLTETDAKGEKAVRDIFEAIVRRDEPR